MQTALTEAFRATPQGREADAILRSCVHCGFCTATCPSYQLLGDELDSPRGRIYLIKQVLEGHHPTRTTQLHLDRCLSCQACETICPSGVRYARLADIGREVVDRAVRRRLSHRLGRLALRLALPSRRRFAALLGLGRLAGPLLPARLRAKIPARRPASPWPPPRHLRTMLVLDGCVQAAATPNTNAAAARVLDRLGVTLVRARSAGCCGALSYHLGARAEALGYMRRNVDAWWPRLDAGAESIVVTASGCGAVVKQYGELLKGEPAYADRAARVSSLARDLCEVLANEDLAPLRAAGHGRRVAFHAPCTLQHGQGIAGKAEGVLERMGFRLTPILDSHLCCGSAGTYSILQPEIAQRLLADKIAALQEGAPEVIATANVGCQLHIETGTRIPVRHWIELVDQAA